MKRVRYIDWTREGRKEEKKGGEKENRDRKEGKRGRRVQRKEVTHRTQPPSCDLTQALCLLSASEGRKKVILQKSYRPLHLSLFLITFPSPSLVSCYITVSYRGTIQHYIEKEIILLVSKCIAGSFCSTV